MAWKALNPARFPFFDYRRHAFSLGIDAGAGIWLAGQTAARLDEATGQMVVGGDAVAQAEVAYDKIVHVLHAAGLGLCNVVRTIEYVTPAGLQAYDRLAVLRRQLFGDALPATSTVVVQRLLLPEALIAIEAVASRSTSESLAAGGSARRVGSMIYLSGIEGIPREEARLEGTPPEGAATGSGADDIAGQVRRIYGRAEALLAAAGVGWNNVVKTTDFLTNAGLLRYRETAAVRREIFGSRFPASTGIIMPRLRTPGALIQVDFVAVEGENQPVYAEPPDPRLTFAPAVRAGQLLYLSGHTATDRETGAVHFPGDVVGQCGAICGVLRKLVEAAGAEADALVQTVDFVTPAGLERYRETAGVRKQTFGRPLPAATGVVCERLLRPEALIEIDGVAVLSERGAGYS